tara:strand:- start:2955 stop:19061 length:16107 start_codon:yes stop_codon:yes gene_type:complete
MSHHDLVSPEELEKSKNNTNPVEEKQEDTGGLKNWDKIKDPDKQPKLQLAETIVSDINVSEYGDYMNQVRLEQGEEKLRKARAVNQSWQEQVGAFANQALLGEVVGGTISAIGSIFEIPTLIYEKAAGETSDFNNGVISLGNDLIEWTRDATPIYRENPNQAWDVGDFGWWASNAVSVASAASMLVPAKATMSGMSWLNKISTKLGKSTGGKLGNFLQTGANMGQIGKNITKAGVSALVMRHAENTRESFGVVNDVNQELSQTFQDEEKWAEAQESEAADELRERGLEVTKKNLAEHIASRAGWRSYNVNFSNIIFDFIQAGALLKGTGITRSKVKSGKVKSKLADKRKTGLSAEAQKQAQQKLDDIANSKFTKVSNAAGVLARQSTEGLEEMINFIGEKEGHVLAKQLLGEDDSTFSQRLGEYLQDPHLSEVAFWGALGGIAFEGINTAFTGSDAKDTAKAQLETIAYREKETTKYVKFLKDVQTKIADGEMTKEEGEILINAKKNQMGTSMGFFAAANRSTNVLLEQLENGQFKQDILNSMTTEEIKEQGMGSIDKAIAKTKEEVLAAEKSFNKHYGRVMNLDIDGDNSEDTKATILKELVSNDGSITKILDDIAKGELNWADLSNNVFVDKVLAANPSLKSFWERNAYLSMIERLKKIKEQAKKGNNKYKEENAQRGLDFALEKVEEIDALYPEFKDSNSEQSKSNKAIAKKLTKASKDDTLVKTLEEHFDKMVESEVDLYQIKAQSEEFLTDKGAQKLHDTRTKFNNLVKEAEELIELNAYETEVKAEVDKLVKKNDLQGALAYLESELETKEKDSKTYKYLENQIEAIKKSIETKELLEEDEQDDDSDPEDDTVSYNKTIEDSSKTPAELLEQVALTKDAELAIAKEQKNVFRNFINRINKILKNTKLDIEEKIAQLQKLKEAQKEYPNTVQLLNNKIFLLNNLITTQTYTELGYIKVGAKYKDSNNEVVEIIEIYENANGDKFVVIERAGVNLYLPFQRVQEAAELGRITEITEESPHYTDLKIKDVFPDIKEVTSLMEALVTITGVNKRTKELARLLHSSGYKLNITLAKDSKLVSKKNPAAFDAVNKEIVILASYLTKNKPYAALVELLEHELIHIELHKAIPYFEGDTIPESREEFNKELREIIALLQDADTSLENKAHVQSIIDLLRKESKNPTGYPEELISYLLADSIFFNAIYTTQNEVANAIKELLIKNKLNVLKDWFISNQAAAVKNTAPNFTPTQSAKNLIDTLKGQGYNIDENLITPTGKNGNVLVKDVEKYIKDNNLKPENREETAEEFFDSIYGGENVLNSNNIWINSLIGITPDGVIDVNHYKAEMKRLYGFTPKMTQDKLEKQLKWLLSPDIGVDTELRFFVYEIKGGDYRIMIKYISPQGSGVREEVVLGSLNSVKSIQKDLNFAKQINEITDIDRLNKGLEEPKVTEAQRKLIQWRIDELEGNEINKPFISHIYLLEKQLQTVKKITNVFKQHNYSPAVISDLRTRVTRKTSGNLLQVGEFESLNEQLNEGLPPNAQINLNNIFYLDPKSASETQLVNYDGQKFTRNADTGAFFNHDEKYDFGKLYILVKGANSIPGELNTYIPVPLDINTLSEAISQRATNLIFELADKLREFQGTEWSTLKKDKDFIKLKETLGTILNVNLDAKVDNIGDNSFKIFDNKMQFSYGDGDTLTIYITAPKTTDSTKKVLNIQVTDKDGNIVPFESVSKKPNTLSLYNKESEELEGRKEIIEDVIKKALQQKKHNINLKALEKHNEVYNDGEMDYNNYFNYLLSSDMLLTDLRYLRKPPTKENEKGEIVTDKNGYPLPSVTNKNAGKRKNSHLIISISDDLYFHGQEGKPLFEEKTETDTKDDTEEEVDTEETDADDTEVDADIQRLADNLLANQKVVVDNWDIATELDRFLEERYWGDVVKTTNQEGKVEMSITSSFRRKKIATETVEEVKEKENIEEVKKWWKKVFGDNIELDTNIVGLIKTKGPDAWGLFSEAMVRLSIDAPKGTAYHEAFHVVFWLYTTEEQRKELYQEGRKKYGNRTNLSLEELMADDFMDYMLKKGATKKVSKKVKGFFAKLRDLIVNFFTKKDVSKLDKLFEDIDSGKFNFKPDEQMVEFAKKLTRYKKPVGGLTRGEQSEVINLLARELITYRKQNPNLTLEDIANNPSKSPREFIKKKLRQYESEKRAEGKSQKRQNIEKVLDQRNNYAIYNELYDKTVNYVNRQFGIEVNKELVNLEKSTELKKEWDDSLIFGTSQKDTVSNFVKGEIMTTESFDSKDTFLGLPVFLDFNKVYPYIQRNMVGSLDFNEMSARLELMRKHNPAFQELLNKLQTDPLFKSAWVSQFKKARPNVDVILYSTDGIKLDSANKNISHYILAEKWQSNINSKLNSGELTLDKLEKILYDYIKIIQSKKNGLYNSKSWRNNDKVVEATEKAFNALGIPLTKEMIEKVLSNPVGLRNNKSKVDFYNNVFKSNLEFIIRPILSQLKNKNIELNTLEAQKEKLTEKDYLERKEKIEEILIEEQSINRLNDVAEQVNVFQYDLIESSYFDVNGNNVYGTVNPSFLSEFFGLVEAASNPMYHTSSKAKEQLLQLLQQYAQDPAMQYSNWLFPIDNQFKTTELIDEFLKNWRYSRQGGVKNTQTKEGYQYRDMPDKAWQMTQVLMYLEGYKNGFSKISMPIPSDSGNIHFINSPIFEGVQNGTVPRYIKNEHDQVIENPLFIAIKNTVSQEMQRMKAARDLLFIVDKKKGTFTPKEHRFLNDPRGYNPDIHLDYTKLEENYYWKELEYSKEAGILLPKLLNEKGEPTGDVFKFQNIPSINQIDKLFIDGMYFADVYKSQNAIQQINNSVYEKINEFIAQQIQRGKEVYGHTEKVYTQSVRFNDYATKDDNGFDNFIAEFMLNNYISNVEQFNYIVGNQAEFGTKKGELYPSKNVNKRAKGPHSPGNAGANNYTGEFYTAATLKDIELKSENYENIVENVAKSLQKSQPNKYGNQTVDINKVNKTKPNYTKMNALEIAVHKITKGYLETNVADGQGYITIARAENILKDYGRWNSTYERLFDKVKKGQPLKRNELELFIQPFKGFYYGREFNPNLKRHVSTQVKYSTIVLIPQLIKNTQLETISNWMEKNEIDEVQFESAEKTGKEYAMDVTDANGNLVEDKLNQFTLEKGYVFKEYKQSNWKLQLDVPDHMMDSKNKLGTQIAKIIIGNLPKGNVYNVAGTEYTRDEYIKHYMDVMIQNIVEDGATLREDIGVEIDENNEFVITDYSKLSDILINEVNRKLLAENYLEAIELDAEGNFNLPLFMSNMTKKWQAILTSLFTDRVVNQKVPGGSGVLLSSVFLNAEVKGDEDFKDDGGIIWHDDVKKRKNSKLQMSTSKDGKVVTAEALLPAWSKQFYVKNEKGEYVLDDINNIPEELRTMISYRIPSEQDYMFTVFKVVGFLPVESGSTIVLPQEYVTAKGFDFDVDKEYIMYHSFTTTDIDGKRTYQKNDYYEKGEEGFTAWLESRAAKKLLENLKDNPDQEAKKLNTQVKRFNTTQQNLHEVKQETAEDTTRQLQAIFDVFNEGAQTNFTEIDELFNYLEVQKERAKATIEYVQNQYGLQHWGRNTKEDLRLRSIQANAFALEKSVKETKNFIISRLKDVKEYNTYVEEVKKKEKQALNNRKKYQALLGAKNLETLRKEYDKLSEAQANTRKARDNRILDIFKAKLLHPDHFSGVVTSQSFEDAADVIDEINTLLGKEVEHLNPATAYAQLEYRKQNISGIALKGMAANSNTFLSVAQVVEMFLADELAFHTNYRTTPLTKEEIKENEKLMKEGKLNRVTKVYSEKELKEKYGEENVETLNKKSRPGVRNIQAETTEDLDKQTVFTLEPFVSKDKRDTKTPLMATVSTKFVGFGSAGNNNTRFYQDQIKDKSVVNSGNYTKDDVVLVSYSRNFREGLKKTKAELKKVLQSGAAIITDNIGTLNSAGSYTPKKALRDFLDSEGAVYTETVIDGQTFGLWRKEAELGDVITEEVAKIDSAKNVFTVTPIKKADKKAKAKAKIATQYIGFAEGIKDSSTAHYAEEAGEYANTGNYGDNDVIFVSIGGKRGAADLRKTQQDKTIREAIKALEAGATIIADNKDYIDDSDYNEGEKRLYKNLEAKGYNYSEITVDGNVLGVWSKSEQVAEQVTDEIKQPSKIKTEKIIDGVEVKRNALTEAEQIELFEMLKPILERQGAVTNKGKDANVMIGLGLRWDYKDNNPNKEPIDLGTILDRGMDGTRSKFGYFDKSINGEPLEPVNDRLKELMTKATGVDASDYDGAIINLYSENHFIHSHQDVSEASDTIGYPVLVVNIGGSGNFSIERVGKGVTELNAGDGYVFGIKGKNRKVWHRTAPNKVDGFLPEITTEIDGKTYPKGSYRISITMRRVKPIKDTGLPSMPKMAKPAKPKPKPQKDYVTVKHKNLGWNNDGTFTNVNGDNTMIHASQVLAMTLDIVKEGLPPNVNTYTFNTFITMLNTGMDIRYTSMFIRQPILNDLSELFFETQGFTEDENLGKEIEAIKNRYITELYKIARNPKNNFLRNVKDYVKILTIDGKEFAVIEPFDSQISNGEDINPDTTELKDLFNIDTSESFAFDVDTLKNHIKNSVSSNYNNLTPIEKARYLQDQIKILEMFKRYKKAGEGYDDMIKATASDRTDVGPSLTRPEMLNKSIQKATYYMKFSQLRNLKVDGETRVEFNGEIMTANELLRRKRAEETTAEEKRTIREDTVIRVESDARVFAKVNGETVPATIAVYGEDSKYPVLKAYKEEAFDAATEILSPLFIQHSVAFRKFIQVFTNDTGIHFNPKNADKLSQYILTYLQNEFEFFSENYENNNTKQRILGAENLEVKTDINISIEDFNKLSTANKLQIMQNKLKDKLQNDTHILNYLTHKLGEKDVKKNSMHFIEFQNTKTDSLLDDTIIDSFLEMWNSNDEFEKSLAQDLVKYSFFTTGLTMNKNSFSKLIPTEVFKEIGLDKFLYDLKEKSKMDNFLLDRYEEIKDKFIRSNWFNTDIVPRVYTKRELGEKGTINGTPDWKTIIMGATKEFIEVTTSEYQNEDLRVVQSDYIVGTKTLLINNESIKQEDILYKKYIEKDGSTYFYPVDKLGSINITESSEKSFIKENQVSRSQNDFEIAIQGNNEFGLNDLNANFMTYNNLELENINAPDKIMYTTATGFIGSEIGKNATEEIVSTDLKLLTKSFGELANKSEFTDNDKIMVTFPTIMGYTTAKTVDDSIFNEEGKFKNTSVYGKIYSVLRANGVVMIKAQKNEDGTTSPTFGSGNIATVKALQNLQTYLKVNKGGNTGLYEKIENGIHYFSKKPFNSDILTNEENKATKPLINRKGKNC